MGERVIVAHQFVVTQLIRNPNTGSWTSGLFQKASGYAYRA